MAGIPSVIYGFFGLIILRPIVANFSDGLGFGAITAWFILGMGRAIGETMAVLMVVGNAPVFPDSISEPIATLTTQIVIESPRSSSSMIVPRTSSPHPKIAVLRTTSPAASVKPS